MAPSKKFTHDKNRTRYDLVMTEYRKLGFMTAKRVSIYAKVSATLASSLPDIFRNYGWDFPELVTEKWARARDNNRRIWAYYHTNGRILMRDVLRICNIGQHFKSVEIAHRGYGWDFPVVWDEPKVRYARDARKLMNYRDGRPITYADVGRALGCRTEAARQKYERLKSLGCDVPDINSRKRREKPFPDHEEAIEVGDGIKSAISLYPPGLPIVEGRTRYTDDGRPVYLLR